MKAKFGGAPPKTMGARILLGYGPTNRCCFVVFSNLYFTCPDMELRSLESSDHLESFDTNQPPPPQDGQGRDLCQLPGNNSLQEGSCLCLSVLLLLLVFTSVLH